MQEAVLAVSSPYDILENYIYNEVDLLNKKRYHEACAWLTSGWWFTESYYADVNKRSIAFFARLYAKFGAPRGLTSEDEQSSIFWKKIMKRHKHMMHKNALQIRWEDERVIQYFEDKEKEDHTHFY
jgi:hypothetical protein